MAIYNSITELVGKTPLLEISNYKRENALGSCIYAKLEYFNPAGSVKDRAALKMIENAEKDGRLTPGSTIIEPTSGNTGIGLCAMGVCRGYSVIIVMPDSMSEERKVLMRAYGATLVLTDGALGMRGAIAEAEKIQKNTPNSIIMGQFENPDNSAAHYESTGPEIWEETNGEVDIFVAGVGTGGTLTGTGKYLKEKNPKLKIVAVEPANSPFLSCQRSGKHNLQGIGAGFLPEVLDTKIYDEIITVYEKDAYREVMALSRTEGILVGISSGAALFAACELAKREENKGKRIVVLLPDGGDRYLSSELFK